MEIRYEPLREPFSTADAEYPQIVSEHGCLRVAFRDWQEKLITLLFYNIAAYSWDDGDAAINANHRDDCSYIVHGSPWLERHREAGTLMPSEVHRHYKLCFNAAGVLQVLAMRLEVQAEAMKNDTDTLTPESSPIAPTDSPSGAEPAFISRARRILNGDIRPEDHVAVPEAVRSAVAEEEARLNAQFGINACAPYIVNLRNEWTLSYLYGSTDLVACRCTDDGVIVFAVGLDEIRTFYNHFSGPERCPGVFIPASQPWQSPDLLDSQSHSPEPLPHSA